MPYQHPRDNNLDNLHKAMEYNSAGEPAIRTVTDIEGDVYITGTVTIPGAVEISNDVGNPVPVSGTVNIGTMPEVEVKNDANNPLPVSANTQPNGDLNPLYVKGTSDSSFFAPMQLDSFGRLRISEPFTLFDSTHLYADNGRIGQYTQGTAGSYHDANASSVVMTVGAAAGDLVYRESLKTFSYQPGKSLLVLQTFCMNPAKPGLRQRQGYFDVKNGLYLERDGAQVNLVRRSSVTGTTLETRVPQSAWNVDPLNGSGPSGLVLDLDRVQILFTDIEWLGVGSVRMGFVINGNFVLCHVFHHANMPSTPTSNSTMPYMTTACLPVRAELENTAPTGSASQYRLICTSVMSEGGYELRGRARSAGHPLSTPRVLATRDVEYPVFSIRLKSGRNNAIVVPESFSIGVTGNVNYQYRLVSSGITTGGTWQTTGTDSTVEYNLNPETLVSGSQLESGYIINSNQSSVSPQLQNALFKYQLERNTFTNTYYEFVVMAVASANGSPIYCTVDWEEVN